MKVQEKIIGNHEFLSCSNSISNQDEEQDLVTGFSHSTRYLDCITCPYKQHYIFGCAKCSMKTLSKLLTSILSVVKTTVQSYCDTLATAGVE